MYVAEWVDCANKATGPLDAFTWRGERNPSAIPHGTLIVVREDDVRKQVDAHYGWYEHLVWSVNHEPRATPAIVSAVSGEWRSGRRARRYEKRVQTASDAVFPNKSSWSAAAANRLLFAVQWPEPRLFEFYGSSAIGAGSVAAVAASTAKDAPSNPVERAVDSVNASTADAEDVFHTIQDEFGLAIRRRVVDSHLTDEQEDR